MSIAEKIESVAESICNQYCKYPERYRDAYSTNLDEAYEAMIKEQCEKCPLLEL